MLGARRVVVLVLVLLAAAGASSLARPDSPALQVPGDLTVEAADASGADVTFTVKAVDPSTGGPLSATCDHPAGGTGSGTFQLTDHFPLGATTVTCSTTVADTVVSGSFVVTVRDTTPPVISNVPPNITVGTRDPAGATVHYDTPTATDSVDGAVPVACSPPPDSRFRVGTTTVTCTAVDAHGNSAAASFTVTVTLLDVTPPAFSNVPAAITVEAVGPAGTNVTYTPPTAVDDRDGPVPVRCVPAPGSLFPLGTTAVHCTAADSAGNSSSTSFSVAVVDTTPPHLVVPGATTVYATSAEGASATDPDVQRFLSSASASDLVDPAPSFANDAPAIFPSGTTTVTFRARDGSGNEASAATTLTVLPEPSPGTSSSSLPGADDRMPPDDVRNLKARAGDRVVRLTWDLPRAADFDHVVVVRSTASPGSPATTIYTGAARRYIDHRVRNGTEYRYVVASLDQAGNASAGAVVVATPARLLLVSPRDGARLVSPPRLTWIASRGARYYNVQLYRAGKKIRSAWPERNTLKLGHTWTYAGQRYRLAPGSYRWYVWPGFGARADARYGALLGTSSFVIVRP